MGCGASNQQEFFKIQAEVQKLRRQNEKLRNLYSDQLPPHLQQIAWDEQTSAQQGILKLRQILGVSQEPEESSNSVCESIEAYFTKRLQQTQYQKSLQQILERILQKYNELVLTKSQLIKKKMPEKIDKEDIQQQSIEKTIEKLLNLQSLESQVNFQQNFHHLQEKIKEYTEKNNNLTQQIQNLKQKNQNNTQILKQSQNEIWLQNAQINRLTSEHYQQMLYYEQHKQSLNKKIKKLTIKQLCRASESIPIKKTIRSFRKWHHTSQSNKDINSSSNSLITAESIQISQPDQAQIIISESQQTTNPILKLLISQNLMKAKPSPPLYMFRFLEEALDKKHESDQKEKADGKRPKTMTDFLIYHLNIAFGKGGVAYRNLAQIVSCLNNMSRQGQKYGIFLSRVFHLFHPDPFPYILNYFLTDIRMTFNKLIDKYDHKRITLGLKTSGYRSKNKSKEALDMAELGGVALLIDVLQLVYQKYSSDRQGGITFIQMIKPGFLKNQQYVHYLICHKIQKLGTTPEGLFNMLDKDGSGSIEPNQFIQGAKMIDLWVSEENIKEFLDSVDHTGQGVISQYKFMQKLNMIKFHNQNGKNPLVVAKIDFLVAFSEIFLEKFRADQNRVMSLFRKSTVSLNEFGRVADQVKPGLSLVQLEGMYEEVKKGEVLRVKEASEGILNHLIGCQALQNYCNPDLQMLLLDSYFIEVERKIKLGK